MKKVIKFILLVTLSFSAVILVDCDAVGSKFNLTLLDDGTYSIGSKNNINYGNELCLSSTYKDKTISVIDDEGFKNQNFSKIYIPSSINKIGKEAFNNCPNLKEIYFNNKMQSFYCTFNDAPVGFEDTVECGENCFGKLNLPSFVTTDLISNSEFTITCNDINLLGNKIEYDIGYIKDTDIRSKGEFSVDSKYTSYTINAKVHGVFKDAKFSIFQDSEKKYSFTARNIKVSATEYNICPISGTFPALLFSLQLKTITNNGSIPTYLALNRPASYDWDKLVYNVIRFPNVTKEQALTNKWEDIKSFVSNYVKDLYLANPNSKFNLYIKDHCADLPLQCFSCNGIKSDQYTINFYSDGSLTPAVFIRQFGIKDDGTKIDCNKKIATMKDDIDRAEQYFLNTRKWDGNYLAQSLLSFPRSLSDRPYVDSMQNYSLGYAMNYDYVSYQTGRLNKDDNLEKVYDNDPEFYQKIKDCCEEMNTNDLLNNLSDDEKTAFKEMYKFNDEIFKESIEKGHDMVLILGGAWKFEKTSFYAYTKMTMEYNGHSTCDYFYKPHPGYPTDLVPERKSVINTLRNEGYNIKEIEASIAAEIILFFQPSLKASGWVSTTFEALDGNDKGVALYDMNKETAKIDVKTSGYYNKIFSFYTEASDEIKLKYLGTTSIENVYLLEYNDEGSSKAQEEYAKHDICLYMLNDNKFRYFKGTTEVDKDGNPI